jgi:hypothetical protein
MLTSLRVANFKSWRNTGPARLAPLTVIFRANSVGKSSFGHQLLALKQTVLPSDRKGVYLGDGNTLIDLGTFVHWLHGRSRPVVGDDVPRPAHQAGAPRLRPGDRSRRIEWNAVSHA